MMVFHLSHGRGNVSSGGASVQGKYVMYTEEGIFYKGTLELHFTITSSPCLSLWMEGETGSKDPKRATKFVIVAQKRVFDESTLSSTK